MKKAIIDLQTGKIVETDLTGDEIKAQEKMTEIWEKELEQLTTNPLETRLAKLEELLNQALTRIDALEKKK